MNTVALERELRCLELVRGEVPPVLSDWRLGGPSLSESTPVAGPFPRAIPVIAGEA
jgi:hypothetical protein